MRNKVKEEEENNDMKIINIELKEQQNLFCKNKDFFQNVSVSLFWFDENKLGKIN